MKRINWKLRIMNKVTLTSLVGVTTSFVYTVLGLFNVVPSVSESDIQTLASILIHILIAVGIVVDPTTDGMGDSDEAMTYNEPKKPKKVV